MSDKSKHIIAIVNRLHSIYGKNRYFISMKEASEFLGLSIITIWRAIDKSEIESIQPHGKKMLQINSFAEWIYRDKTS